MALEHGCGDYPFWYFVVVPSDGGEFIMPHRIEFTDKNGKGNGRFRIWCSPQEVNELLTVGCVTSDQRIILTLMSRGLRVSEAVKANSETDMFRDARGLMLQVPQGKTAYREVPIPETLANAKFPIIRRGSPISTNTALTWTREAGERIGIKNLSCHDLRRSFCQNALRTVPSEMVRQWSGHSSQETFERHYISTNDISFQAFEREKLEGILSGE